MASNAKRRFIVVLRASSSLTLPIGLRLNVALGPEATELERPTVVFATAYRSSPTGLPVPDHMAAFVNVNEQAADRAADVAAKAAMTIAPCLVTATNAAIQPFDSWIAYEHSPRDGGREYIQRFVPDATGPPQPGRAVANIDLQSVVDAMYASDRPERMHRAMSHYHAALLEWVHERVIQAVTHLWMAFETLTPVVRERELKKMGLDRAGLADAWGVPETPNRWNELDGRIRERLIFAGATSTYQDCRNASDGCEHGNKSVSEVLLLAQRSRDPAADAVRATIIRALDLPLPLTKELLAHPFDAVMPPGQEVWYVAGRLVGDTQVAAPDGRPHPQLLQEQRWIETRLRVVVVGLADHPPGRARPLQGGPCGGEVVGVHARSVVVSKVLRSVSYAPSSGGPGCTLPARAPQYSARSGRNK
jgi:hypothetical protein